VGQGDRPFDIYKFRTMRQGAEAEEVALKVYNESTGPLFKMRADPRITGIGGFLRRSSLDELPQFINVLRGEMSVVGPRPGRPAEVAEYQPWHRQRLEVPPGITGLWQVSGRSDLTFDEMCLLDVYYIENWSLGLDLSIMLRTVPRVGVASRRDQPRDRDGDERQRLEGQRHVGLREERRHADRHGQHARIAGGRPPREQHEREERQRRDEIARPRLFEGRQPRPARTQCEVRDHDREPDDGVPAHSADSVLRAKYGSTS
jgi:hypothetical protein